MLASRYKTEQGGLCLLGMVIGLSWQMLEDGVSSYLEVREMLAVSRLGLYHCFEVITQDARNLMLKVMCGLRPGSKRAWTFEGFIRKPKRARSNPSS